MKETRGANLAWCSLAMLAGILCIAWSAIFVRWTDMPGPASAFYRLLIPAIVLLPTWFFDRDKTRMDAKSLAIIAIGGLFFALDLAFYNTSILLTSAANATILGNNTPIFVGLLTWLVFRRPPSVTYWLGLTLAMVGSLVIVRGDLLRHVKFGSGDAMALAASACFGVYLLATERVRKTASTIGFLRLAILSSTMFLLLINLAMGTSLAVPSGRSWAAPREGPATVLVKKARSYRQARRPAKFAAVRFIFVAPVNLQLPRERERRTNENACSSKTVSIFAVRVCILQFFPRPK